MFRHRRQLRQWAARVLLVWLFGLASSVVNACLTTGESAAAAAARVAAADAPHGVAAHAADAAHDHGAADEASRAPHGPDGPLPHGGVATPNCMDFCDKATVSIPSLKSTPIDLQAPAAIAIASVTLAPPPALAPAWPRAPQRGSGAAPPIPIAFLRLAR